MKIYIEPHNWESLMDFFMGLSFRVRSAWYQEVDHDMDELEQVLRDFAYPDVMEIDLLRKTAEWVGVAPPGAAVHLNLVEASRHINEIVVGAAAVPPRTLRQRLADILRELEIPYDNRGSNIRLTADGNPKFIAELGTTMDIKFNREGTQFRDMLLVEE